MTTMFSSRIGRRAVAAVAVMATALVGPTAPMGAAAGPAVVNVSVTNTTENVDVDDVTVLVRWVGDGVDLGPAPEGDPVFDGLPAEYSVLAPPVVTRVETGTTVTTDHLTEIDKGDAVYGVDYIGDPDDPLTWVAIGDDAVNVFITYTTKNTTTHHITETRTSTVERTPVEPEPEVTVPSTTAPASSAPATSAPSTTVGESPASTTASTSAPPAAVAPVAAAVPGRPTYAG